MPPLYPMVDPPLRVQDLTIYAHRLKIFLLSFQDLIKYTPEEHPDYEMLQSFMKRSQEFLEKNYSQQPEVDVSTGNYTRNQNVISEKSDDLIRTLSSLWMRFL